MADVRESWRTERLNAAVYDAAVEREHIARLFGRLMWGTDTRRLFERIAELGQLPPGSRVLDVPCGGGLAFRGLRPGQDIGYTAADISPFMLGRAREQARRRGLSGLEFAEADALSLPFTNASFDVCVSFNGLHCLPAQRPALSQVVRVLRPGGTFRGTTIVQGAGPRQDALIGFMRRIDAFGETSTLIQLRSWLEQAGFADVRTEASGALAHFSARRPD